MVRFTPLSLQTCRPTQFSERYCVAQRDIDSQKDTDLQAHAVLGEFPDAIHGDVDDLLADSVVAAGVVVGGVLAPGDELLRVEQLPVGARPDRVCGVDVQHRLIQKGQITTVGEGGGGISLLDESIP